MSACRACWVSSIPPWRCCFQPDLRGFPFDTGPRSLALPGSSSPELPASPESYLLHTCTPLARRAPSLGFLPPSRHQHRESTFGGNPAPTFVPSSAFPTLSTACSSRYLAGLFHPAATSEVHSSGAFPDCQPSWLVARSCPLDVRFARLPRASSVLQLASLVFRALIRPPVRCRRRVV